MTINPEFKVYTHYSKLMNIYDEKITKTRKAADSLQLLLMAHQYTINSLSYNDHKQYCRLQIYQYFLTNTKNNIKY
jgi:hypothetical protein